MSAYNSMHKVLLLGRLGRDPELRYSTSGNPIARFSLATTERTKNQNGVFEEKAEWHRIIVFGAQAENCSKFLKKGSLVFIEGRLQTREYQDNNGVQKSTTEIIVSVIHFLEAGGPVTGEKTERTYQKPATQADDYSKAVESANMIDEDDDLPF